MPGINFAEVNKTIHMDDVLYLIGWRASEEGAYTLRGPCPFHKSSSASSRSFAITGSSWYCHKCKRGGNKISLYAEVVGLPIYDAVKQLCERLNLRPCYLPRGALRRAPRNSEEER
jgi:hypothetical protein